MSLVLNPPLRSTLRHGEVSTGEAAIIVHSGERLSTTIADMNSPLAGVFKHVEPSSVIG